MADMVAAAANSALLVGMHVSSQLRLTMQMSTCHEIQNEEMQSSYPTYNLKNLVEMLKCC